jgi:ketosteroid isomerase-like protein
MNKIPASSTGASLKGGIWHRCVPSFNGYVKRLRYGGYSLMSQENVAVVRSAYNAFSSGNVQTIFDLLHPEIEIYQSEGVPCGGKYKGHQEIGNFFEKLTETIESRVEPDQFIDDEAGHVVAVGHTRGRVRATGREFDVPAVHVWTIREGKAVKVEAYIDTAEMRVALGLVTYLTDG